MKKFALAVLLAALPLLLLFAAEEDREPWKRPVGYAPKQPIAYSHKTHLALGLKCNGCHTAAGDGFQMGFPKEAFCMGCHSSVKTDSPEIAKLAEAARTKNPVPWARVYRTMDIVWFSHASHKDAKIECGECHGDVAQMSVVTKFRALNMKDCMDCHAERQAPNGCDFCHASQ